MPFISNPIATEDSNNSTLNTLTALTSFNGIKTNVVGYESLTLYITANVNSVSSGIVIYFSDTQNGTYTSCYTDTYYTKTRYVKTFSIIKPWYYISYTTLTSQSTFNLSSYLMNVQNNQNNVTSFNTILLDTYSRLKVVEPKTLLDIKLGSNSSNNINSNLEVIYNSTVGTATIGIPVNSTALLQVVTTGDNAISQSRKYSRYQPNRSMNIELSGILNNGGNAATVISCMGYYDTGISGGSVNTTGGNGLFFCYNFNSVSGVAVNMRNTTSLGVMTNTTVSQNNWDDKMDGTGTSGITIDFTKLQVFIITFSWLGSGVVKFGFNVLGTIYYCYTFPNYNTLSYPWCTNPSLPVRYEILSLTGSGSLLQCCASIISWGGYDPIGRPFSAYTGIDGAGPTLVTVNSGANEVPLLAISGNGSNIASLGNTYYHQNIIPISFTVLDTTTNNSIIRVRLYQSQSTINHGPNNTVNPVWSLVNSNSVVVVSTGTNITTGGTFTTTNSILINTTLNAGKTSIPISDLGSVFNSIFQLTSNTTNTSDILCITAETFAGNSTMACTLNWQEFF
jgi:hypothetical protein